MAITPPLGVHLLPDFHRPTPNAPSVPMIAPKPSPHGALGGAEFGGHLGKRLAAPEVASKASLGGYVCCNGGSVSFIVSLSVRHRRQRDFNQAMPELG
jgi:hypothetical protein